MQYLADISQFESLIQTQCFPVGNIVFNADPSSANTADISRFLDLAEQFDSAYNTEHKRPYDNIISEAEREVQQINEDREDGLISEDEAHNRIIDIWQRCSDEVDEAMWRGYERHNEFMQRFPDWPRVHGMAPREEITNEYINRLSPKEMFALQNCYQITHGNSWRQLMAFKDEGFDDWYGRLCSMRDFRGALWETRDLAEKIGEENLPHELDIKDLLDDPYGSRALDRLLYQQATKNKPEQDIPATIYDDTDGGL